MTDQDLAHLTTARLLLRRPTSLDLPRFYEIYGDPQTNLFNPAGPIPSLEAARVKFEHKLLHWQSHGHGTWAVALLGAPEDVIGFGGLAGLHFGETERTNLGFRFATSAWGSGYASELAAASVEVARDRLHLDEIWATARESHSASRRVLEKIGMQRIAVKPDPRGVPASVWYRLTLRDGGG